MNKQRLSRAIMQLERLVCSGACCEELRELLDELKESVESSVILPIEST